jgi:serine protease Do
MGHTVWKAAFCAACFAAGLHADSASEKKSARHLEQFSESVQALAAKVAPSVVQISVTAFAALDPGTGHTGIVLGRQQVVGSGVIIDPDGYIVTNAHVVENALRIRVSLTARNGLTASSPDRAIEDSLAQSITAPVDASLVGVFKELDVALIRIPAKGLPALRFADYGKLRQGTVVFAFGSRQGLGNSMSMGVVSSVARQPTPDSPFVYIQTDAPINPGDSGGPLVDTAGEIVGLDTFILTQSGGSEGIGFAIPSTLVELVSAKLRQYGHMHRQLIGVGVQAITPTLAAALGLARDSGVLISDVTPGGPAETAGARLNDIVTAINERPVESVPMFTTAMLALPAGGKVTLNLLRGRDSLAFETTPREESHSSDRLADMIDPQKNRVRQLGIVGIAVDKEVAGMFPELRGPYGVIVAALSASAAATPTGLEVGDVIHEVNGEAVADVEELRRIVAKHKRGDAVALFIERDGRLQYLAFEME